jgi:hypothetical protein
MGAGGAGVVIGRDIYPGRWCRTPPDLAPSVRPQIHFDGPGWGTRRFFDTRKIHHSPVGESHPASIASIAPGRAGPPSGHLAGEGVLGTVT